MVSTEGELKWVLDKEAGSIIVIDPIICGVLGSIRT